MAILKPTWGECVGGPHCGHREPIGRKTEAMVIWHRDGEVTEPAGGEKPTVTVVMLGRPTRHRYDRTGRRTADGAVVFRHAGRFKGLFA